MENRAKRDRKTQTRASPYRVCLAAGAAADGPVPLLRGLLVGGPSCAGAPPCTGALIDSAAAAEIPAAPLHTACTCQRPAGTCLRSAPHLLPPPRPIRLPPTNTPRLELQLRGVYAFTLRVADPSPSFRPCAPCDRFTMSKSLSSAAVLALTLLVSSVLLQAPTAHAQCTDGVSGTTYSERAANLYNCVLAAYSGGSTSLPTWQGKSCPRWTSACLAA